MGSSLSNFVLVLIVCSQMSRPMMRDLFAKWNANKSRAVSWSWCWFERVEKLDGHE